MGLVRVGSVWFGLVWASLGLVWVGSGWFGLVWSGLGWFGLVWVGSVWFGSGLVWSGLGRLGSVGIRYSCVDWEVRVSNESKQRVGIAIWDRGLRANEARLPYMYKRGESAGLEKITICGSRRNHELWTSPESVQFRLKPCIRCPSEKTDLHQNLQGSTHR